MVFNWMEKKGKTSKFVNAGGYNRNERERERDRERESGNNNLEMVDRKAWRIKIKLTLGTFLFSTSL